MFCFTFQGMKMFVPIYEVNNATAVPIPPLEDAQESKAAICSYLLHESCQLMRVHHRRESRKSAAPEVNKRLPACSVNHGENNSSISHIFYKFSEAPWREW